AFDFAQRIKEAVALLVRVRLARVVEQFLLELVDRRHQRMSQATGRQAQKTGEHVADARRQILSLRQFLQHPLVRRGHAPKRGTSLRHDRLPLLEASWPTGPCAAKTRIPWMPSLALQNKRQHRDIEGRG